ncbi:ribonuclease [Sphingomonas sp. C3-2]|uniref:ribonuclease n=1 Tax=Sphingomonas sp. C3-2 TaxID=3062169 RepID=UPI00294ACE7C|nr:ribonuclease [Sphingomonas sp. C3-2]WOK38052.1 ribonuclease [Sphingomonas sp. C3-2]
MAEWLYERGIGEDRAALVVDDSIVEAHIERTGASVRAGTIALARLTRILIPARRGIATLADGEEILLEPLPPKLSEGRELLVEILRGLIPESGRAKLAKARPAAADAVPTPGPALRERLAGSGHPVRELLPYDPDLLERAGWGELLEEAQLGEIAFAGGGLRLSLTPAMALFDVDGTLAPEQLAIAGARAAGRAIRRFGLAGSIGIDLPTIGGKAERQAAATALDAEVPQPFERTAVNGFGFLQLVRRRTHAALPELLQGDPVLAAALSLLRQAERAPGHGARTLSAAASVIAVIESHPEWVAELARRIGASVSLRAAPGLAISAGHVSSEHP